MVDKKIVLDTIQKMLDSGLEDAVIVSTLKDVGLSEEDIGAFLKEAKGKGASPLTASSPETEEKSAGALKKKPVKGTPSDAQHEENVLMHTTTQAAVIQSTQQMDDVLQKIGVLEKSLGVISQLPLQELNEKIVRFDKKISDLAKDVMETKAQTRALKEVLEKVLDTNRSILSELESKKN
ncbi:hypothetical protein KKE06_05915 [Candidatus Micrarchaeota archaeon]|nr:hypothetical protein [Candidatus Micrarchaeota archaeon]MBU1930705.1 hypothetical protein [Candidatus Micrarchaeota archaeon]